MTIEIYINGTGKYITLPVSFFHIPIRRSFADHDEFNTYMKELINGN